MIMYKEGTAFNWFNEFKSKKSFKIKNDANDQQIAKLLIDLLEEKFSYLETFCITYVLDKKEIKFNLDKNFLTCLKKNYKLSLTMKKIK